MILIQHSITKVTTTVHNQIMLNNLLRFDKKWKILDKNHNFPRLNEEIIEPVIIEKKNSLDTSAISLSEFKEMSDIWTKEELNMFAKDKRKGISNAAKFELKNRI